MTFCKNCGKQIEDNAQFCPGCGAPAETNTTQQAQTQQPNSANDFSAKFEALNNTADTTAEYDKADIEKNKYMAMLAYFGPLVIIPMLVSKDSKFARYHCNQGIILLIAAIAYSIAYGILSTIIYAISWRLGFISSILGFVSIIFTVLAILGIVNAVSGKAKELPLIGKFKILK